VAEYLPGTSRVEVEARKVERGGIGGHLSRSNQRRQISRRKGSVILALREMRQESWGPLGFWSQVLSSTVETLLHAESKVHGHFTGDVELAELGDRLDTLIECPKGSPASHINWTANATWWSTPVAVGGTSHFHPFYPNPPPAVARFFEPQISDGGEVLETRSLAPPTGVG